MFQWGCLPSPVFSFVCQSMTEYCVCDSNLSDNTGNVALLGDSNAHIVGLCASLYIGDPKPSANDCWISGKKINKTDNSKINIRKFIFTYFLFHICIKPLIQIQVNIIV